MCFNDGDRTEFPKAHSLIFESTCFTGICWGAGIYIAVGSKGEIVRSTDGINWTVNKSSGLNQISAIAWGAGIFVVVGKEGKIAWSEDGIDWEPAELNPFNDAINTVIWDGRRFAAGGNNGIIAYSIDGDNWVEDYEFKESKLFGSQGITSMASNGKSLVAVSANGLIARCNIPEDAGGRVLSYVSLERMKR
jgi:hypothetical protein